VRLARGRTYPIRADRLKPPLNLLVVLSSPAARTLTDESLSFDIYEEKRSLFAELKPLVDAGLLRVDIEDRPTLQNLRRRIGAQRRGYHLFHYLGHAEPDKLILEDDAGRRDDQSASRFMEILRLCPDLRLAVFAGCETARAAGDPLTVDAGAIDGWRQIMSLADRCVQESSPVVVGMQAVLPFRTERLFTRFFYQGIVSGYSVIGAMRLARTATRGDRHVGGDLLDWSVPVVFVGGADPGPMVDRSTRGVPPKEPARHVLRLGLRQRETRFFARDVALRQTIDVLSGKAPERVLVLTGPASVGKTMLIDRALEEIGGPIFILYVRLDDIAPELMLHPEMYSKAGDLNSWAFEDLAEMRRETPLKRLCKHVAELLKREDGRRHDPELSQGPSEWWLRLIEELASRPFVIVIDNVGSLVRMDEPLTRRLTGYWLQRHVEQLLDKRVGVYTVAKSLGGLIEHVRRSADYTEIDDPNPLVSELSELHDWLSGWSRTARDCVASEAARWLRYLDSSTGPTPEELKERARKDELEQPLLRKAARALVGARDVLSDAFSIVADRRSGVRLAVVAEKLPDKFLNLPSDQRFVMRLGRLTWFETWRWIRRNLPGLLRYGDEYLERLWPRLGTELELWEELERRILEPGINEPPILKIVDEIVPRPPSTNTTLPSIDLPRGGRPLRLAVAGPNVEAAEALALAITRLAAEYGIGGRVGVQAEDERGSLAVLVDVPSPTRDGMLSTLQIRSFLHEVSDRQADIVLLDYRYLVDLPLSSGPETDLLGRLHHRMLFIAASGNLNRMDDPKKVSAPGVYSEVLAVGSLDNNGCLQAYAEWIPELRKPDIFMVDQLIGTDLERTLGRGGLGSSFAALHAVGAAILVWSTLPDLTPDELRELLCRASRPVEMDSEPRPLMLTVQAAVEEARRELMRRTLREGPCSLQALAAITGLELRLVNDTLDLLLSNKEVRRLTRGRLERYELITF
jgi:hypothetical protein